MPQLLPNTIAALVADRVISVENTTAPIEFLSQEAFLRTLGLERKRSERSGRPFALMLLQSSLFAHTANRKASNERPLGKIAGAIRAAVRETDFQGWYREQSAIGILFTELGNEDPSRVSDILRTKIKTVLREHLKPEQTDRISISLHVFPDSSDEQERGGPHGSALYGNLLDESNRSVKASKRILDVTGSALALLLFAPVLAAIALSIKMTSKGGIIFRQVRVGEDGRRFTFLKFRSMHEANNHAIHEEYVRRLIAGSVEAERVAGNVFKLTDDPRITPLGKLLRKTSLDELPQLVNVFRGEMSLVGPRPPVPYEYDCYKIWHRARLFGVKPGLTGLWQVGGRSRVGFNDMVRLDLQYARTRSVWLDIKILLRTPAAVLTGDGAY